MTAPLIRSLSALLFLLAVSTVVGQKPELSVQTGHAAQVVTLAFSSDGKILASGSVDHIVKIWEPSTGSELRALKGHDMTVLSVVFSPDDKLIASGSADNTVKIWDVNTGVEKQTLRGHTLYVQSVEFSPDGKLIASGSADQKVKLWDVATGTELRTLLPNIDPNYSIGLRVAFSRDGRTLITAGEVVKVWDVNSGRLIRTIKLEGFGPIPVFPIAASPDGKVFVTGGKTIRVWDFATGEMLRSFPGDARELSFSRDGRTLAGTGGLEIKTWDFNSGRELKSWEGPPQGVESVALDPDGKVLATGNYDHTVRLWDSNKADELRVLKGQTDRVASVALSGDGKVLVSGIMGTIGRSDSVRIWDPVTGQLLKPLTAASISIHSLDINHDGSKLIGTGSGSASYSKWNLSLSDSVETVKYPQSGPSGFRPGRLAMSADARLVALGGRNGVVKLSELESGREIFSLPGHKNDVWALVMSRKGDVLASADSDSTIKLWSSTGQVVKVLKGHAGGVGALAFTPDGTKLASGSHDKTIFLWDVATGTADDSFVGNNAWVNSVAFSHDGSKLACGNEDGIVRIWDVKTRRPLQTMTGHKDRVDTVVFSANNKLLISGSFDTSLKLWDVATGQELASLFSLGQQDWLVLTPDGLFDGSPAAWNQILWRFSSKLFDVAPVELFFNEYYYPGLLAEIYAGKRPVAPQNISQKDRRQPVLKLSVDDAQVAAANRTSRNIAVKLEISQAPAGAQDVRLFRNGALVKTWRGDVLKGQGRVMLETQIPIVAGANRLTAYAFNRDNVKSSDATLTVTGNEGVKQPGTLYILAIAVNKYANSQFDLRYAVADATDFAGELESQEAKLKNFGRTEIIALHDAEATKPNILAAMGRLAARVKPEDAVIVYYAGHGTAQLNQFYLIPHDLGYQGPRNKIDAASLKTVLSHSISDRELERAFEGIDAGRLLLVIDACNSGQALEAEEKRRGPMNSKGLAQLAYEKGIYILTAAQSYQAAMEPSDLKHGLLTYALVEEGLKKEAADLEPKDGKLLVREWFSYVMKRVPQIQQQKMREASQSGRQLVYVEGDEETDANNRKLQRPRVFYRRELEENPFVVARTSAVPQ
ncbi:MAG TPA: caspase family protein [Pyrinomonadaceae bacterium]|nr:caspase family protein [Pyrinomonadaceae bacterium]